MNITEWLHASMDSIEVSYFQSNGNYGIKAYSAMANCPVTNSETDWHAYTINKSSPTVWRVTLRLTGNICNQLSPKYHRINLFNTCHHRSWTVLWIQFFRCRSTNCFIYPTIAHIRGIAGYKLPNQIANDETELSEWNWTMVNPI